VLPDRARPPRLDRRLLLESDNNGLATAETKWPRYSLVHTAGHIVTTARQHFCRLAGTWPWTRDLIVAFEQLHQIPPRI
jgi:hypothetical protein